MATEKKWQNSPMIERMFVWTWDARPYPFWPDMRDIWADGNCWLRGHWVNGKLGMLPLALVIRELCLKSGLALEDFNANKIRDFVEGYVITNQCPIRAVIEVLMQAYFLNVVENEGILYFLPKKQGNVYYIAKDSFVLAENKILQITRIQECELPKRLNLHFINKLDDYQQGVASVTRQCTSSEYIDTIALPLVIDQNHSDLIAETIMYNKWIERNLYSFVLPVKYCYIKPGDLIKSDIQNKYMCLSVLSTSLESSRSIRITAAEADLSIYDHHRDIFTERKNKINFSVDPGETKLFILDLPTLPFDDEQKPCLYCAALGMDKDWIGASIIGPKDEIMVVKGNTVGVITSDFDISKSAVFDYENSFEVQLYQGNIENKTKDKILNWHNIALVGEEIIQFTDVKQITENKYKLSGLLRGRLGTESKICKHKIGELFILLDDSLVKFNLSINDIGKELNFAAISLGRDLTESKNNKFIYQAISLHPYSVADIKLQDQKLTWKRRSRIPQDWRDKVDITLAETQERYLVEVYQGNILVESIETNNAVLDISAYTEAEFKIRQISNLV
jgi:hypothetical protein